MFTLSSGENIPLEFHKARVVQKINLIPAKDRLKAMRDGGFNTFLLQNKDVFLDMLTDSGVNAISDRQLAAMFIADDAYAGSESFNRFQAKLNELFGTPFVLPVHQGRAAENVICRTFVKPGSVIPMNYHFTTTKAHIELNGGRIEELVVDEGLKESSDCPFKGNMNIAKLQDVIAREGKANIPFVRMEAGTNLIGGQPFSLQNLRDVKAELKKHGIMLLMDASLLAENIWFTKTREETCKNMPLKEIVRQMADLCDVIYFSARKLGCAKGGGIITKSEALYDAMKGLIPLFEGFLTYGGMSVREIEAITVGLDDLVDERVICQAPDSIAFMVEQLEKEGIPVVTPPGGLGCHLDAKRFLPHIPQEEYPAGALAAALYLVSGIRGMERGTLSSVRGQDGKDVLSDMELLRLALPRRVFTMSHVKFAVDRIAWLFKNRKLIGGLKFIDEPTILRFFMGKLAPTSGWDKKLVEIFGKEFGEN